MSPTQKSKGGILGGLLGGGGAKAAAPSEGPFVRPMEMEDLPAALDIIDAHDDDDAEEAEEALNERQCAGMLVVEENGQILGLTGAVPDEDVPDIRWLSWTYLREDARGKGVGFMLVNELLSQLDQEGVRKIFIATSDYKEDGKDIYADARAFYEEMGAREELRIPDYHDTGETKIIYSLINENIDPGPPLTAETQGVTFEDFAEAPESEDGYGLIWTETEEAGVSGLATQLDRASREGARAVFVELPDDLSAMAEADLSGSGFTKAGALTDYYGPGADQIHWIKLNRA